MLNKSNVLVIFYIWFESL